MSLSSRHVFTLVDVLVEMHTGTDPIQRHATYVTAHNTPSQIKSDMRDLQVHVLPAWLQVQGLEDVALLNFFKQNKDNHIKYKYVFSLVKFMLDCFAFFFRY